jgi:hypothetical protein
MDTSKVWFVRGASKGLGLSFLKKLINFTAKTLLFVVLSNFTHFAFSQEIGDIADNLDVSGAVSITNKGISIIPSLTLGKPAAVFDLSIGKRIRFEPQFRFSLEGKPWSFLFWWRYEVLRTNKLRLNIGSHPAISFKSFPISSNGVSKEITEARRFLAGELNSSYSVMNNINVGIYYLYSYGFEEAVPDNTHYISFKGNISNINLFYDLFLTISPQIYYLKIDENVGYYIASSFRLGKRNFPLSLSSIFNKTIQTDILASPNFLWNVSLNYSFDL